MNRLRPIILAAAVVTAAPIAGAQTVNFFASRVVEYLPGEGNSLFPDSSLALDESGYPHISYCDRQNDDLKYAYQDASGWHLETVDCEGDVGKSTSLVLDGDGYAHISYLDWGNGDLKYAHQDASGWHIKAVDADAERDTSLALYRFGHPHVSYYGASALKYAYQDASGWHVELVDEVGDPDSYTSLVLDGDDRPHISYHDLAGFDLKYAYQDDAGWQRCLGDGRQGLVCCNGFTHYRHYLIHLPGNLPHQIGALIGTYNTGCPDHR